MVVRDGTVGSKEIKMQKYLYDIWNFYIREKIELLAGVRDVMSD